MMIRKISDIIYKATGVIISCFLALIVVLTFAQVMSRYLFKFSIDWAQELTVYLMVWLVFLGCSMGMKNEEVASLSFVIQKFNQRVQKIFKLLANSCIILFSLVSTYHNREVVAFAMKKRSPIIGIKMGYVSVAFSICSVIVAINCGIAIYDTVKKKES
jgi:TRAP-type C4-dicarboxylate transport system permease small subunit